MFTYLFFKATILGIMMYAAYWALKNDSMMRKQKKRPRLSRQLRQIKRLKGKGSIIMLRK